MDKNPIPTVSDKQLSPESLSIKAATNNDFVSLQSWFTHRRQVLLWAGPNMPFPTSLDTFVSTLSQANFISFTLQTQQQMIGFGQCQLHKQHMHLGRLAIHPKYRGKGLSYVLVNKMISQGNRLSENALNTVSLFVFTANKAALNAYMNMGFVAEPTPVGLKGINGCEYMCMHL